MRLLILFISILSFSTSSYAQAIVGGILIPSASEQKHSDSIALDLSLGSPSGEITNPDNTTAYYDGVSAAAKFKVPFYRFGGFVSSVNLGMRYLDFENTANSSGKKEVAQHIGTGLGLELRLWRFFVGYNYYLMKARHYGVAEISSDSLEYDYSATNIYYGIMFKFNQLGVGLSSESSKGSVPRSKTNLSKDSPYKDQVYWLHLRYDLNMSLSELIKSF